ncbi:MAG: tetratricopeptide repeat protein [Alphaproteobacteria bacterium]|nr:tetratricopeptide repeat protein [Alphaproteobacteria bacterium]
MSAPPDPFAVALSAARAGDMDTAREACVAALRAMPTNMMAHNLFGLIHLNQGRFAEAAIQFGRVLIAEPANAQVMTRAGQAEQARNPAGALRLFRLASLIDPLDSLPHVASGRLLSAARRHDEAVEACRRAVRLAPRDKEALTALGAVLQNADRMVESAEVFGQALADGWQDGATWNMLGISLQRAGRFDEAATAYMRALMLSPGDHDAMGNLAADFFQQNRLDAAERIFRLAVVARPDNPMVLNNLALLLGRRGRYAQAATAFRRACAFRPDFFEAFLNLARAALEIGDVEQALAMSRLCTRLDPRSSTALAALAMNLNYDQTSDPPSVAEAHRRWAVRHADPLTPERRPVDWDGERRLRVGYVSADFWWHSVSYFFEPLLEAHDRRRFEVFCYSDAKQQDVVSERLQGKAEHWRRILGLSDGEVAERIRQDGIDILVDLGGHTADNRLLVFARRPAPIQVSWLGYPNTTGMKAMDFRLTDAITDPAPQADGWSGETLVRLPGGFHCYRAPTELDEPAPPPCEANGFVTFGSFNSLAKINAPVIALWSRVLRAVPGSRLVVKSRPMADEGVLDHFAKSFAAHGVERDRLVLTAYIGEQSMHMRAYDMIDIGLDPFPYNGTTTTCEAFWMGVPVITLLGVSHAGRVGASLCGQLGLHGLVARDPDDYVRRAATLAADRARLGALRRSLRGRMRASPLGDPAFLARKIEAAFVEMIHLVPDGR